MFSYPDHKARQSKKKKTPIAAGKRAPETSLSIGNIGPTVHLSLLLPLPGRDTTHFKSPWNRNSSNPSLVLYRQTVPTSSIPPSPPSQLSPRSQPATILTATKGKFPPTMQRKRSYTQIARGQNDTASHRQLSFPSSANLGPASADTAPVQAKRARGQSELSFPSIVLLLLDLHLHPPHIVRQLASSIMVKLLGSDGYQGD